ncbi:oxidoreductase [Mycobacterium sp. NS-7484]|nr:oxidoreductase [Mycobacterium sp. E802]OMC02356.1 oxidoreductase [Mycobacterium sp. NS-7484]
MLTIAIVGSGPSGCYIAQFLAKQWPHAEITIFESLPTPYGLVRYGVAADHQGAKGVTKQFDRLFAASNIRFAGNVTIGRDLPFQRLAECFDVVVLATGLPGDRRLNVPQAPGTRVIGAGDLLRAFNSHPHALRRRHAAGTAAALGRQIVIVGMGNVAVDVARLTCKEAEGLLGSDINDTFRQEVLPNNPLRLDILSRSSATQAKCDVSMLRELLALPNVETVVSGVGPEDTGAIVDLLDSAVQATGHRLGQGVPTRVHLHFGVRLDRVEARNGANRVCARTDGGTKVLQIDADTVVTAIGFTEGGEHDVTCPSASWSGAHVYRVGWLNRGPRGTIPENRKEARQIAESIIKDVADGRVVLGRPGFSGVAPILRGRVVNFSDWQRIEAFEVQSAPPDRCRRKIADIGEMLSVASTS